MTEEPGKRLVDEVYAERNQLVAALTKHFPSHYAIDETVDPEWRYVICVHLPTGQATWHIREDEYGWFAHLEDFARPQHWDEHDTAEKYRRLASLELDWFSYGRAYAAGERL